MKKIIFLVIFSITILGCHKDSFNNSNPYLPNYGFSIDLDLSFNQYQPLTFASNAIHAYPANGPSKGIIVFNTGSGYTAYDGSCPNQAITSCSALSISGINAVCSCDGAIYNLFTGLATGKQYPLKAYRVVVTGNVIKVYN